MSAMAGAQLAKRPRLCAVMIVVGVSGSALPYLLPLPLDEMVVLGMWWVYAVCCMLNASGGGVWW